MWLRAHTACASMQAKIKREGSGALAEACALCCERLLALARSVSAHSRYGRPADDGIRWPQAPVPAAAMLRREVGFWLPGNECTTPLGGAFGMGLCPRAGKGGARLSPASCEMSWVDDGIPWPQARGPAAAMLRRAGVSYFPACMFWGAFTMFVQNTYALVAVDGPRLWSLLPPCCADRCAQHCMQESVPRPREGGQAVTRCSRVWLSIEDAAPQLGQQADPRPPALIFAEFQNPKPSKRAIHVSQSQRHTCVQARRMIEDIEVVGAAFADALAEVSNPSFSHPADGVQES